MNLASNQQNSTFEPQTSVTFYPSDGFNSFHYSPVPPEVEICPKETATLEYKQNLARDIVASLLSATDNPLMIAQALRIAACNSDGNLFVAEDLHTADGEAFNGKGTLWSCNSRLCPNCVGRLSNRSRKIIRYVMENQKLFVGEDWYFVTFTMPNLNLKNLPLPIIAKIIQSAWKRFTALETRANKRKTWFQETIRGGHKNCEFTYTENDVYHYHIHSLLIANSAIKSQNNDFYDIREYWTKALRFAFDKFNIPLEINTVDGLAVVNVQQVDSGNREKIIQEVAKYVTKNDSWSKIPIEQLEEIVAVPRFWRMFEAFGVCRLAARQRREKAVTARLNALNDTQSKTDNKSENIASVTNLDTKDIINRQPTGDSKAKRVAWRIRAMSQSFLEFKADLEEEIRVAQKYRRRQLQEKYECARFQTLDGTFWSAALGSGYRKFRATTSADTDLGAWFDSRIPSRQSSGLFEELAALERNVSQPLPLDADAVKPAPSKQINLSYQLPNTAPTVQAKRLSNWDIFNNFCDLGSACGNGE
jgi:plasmid rolling circle replication initiator protein Rep